MCMCLCIHEDFYKVHFWRNHLFISLVYVYVEGVAFRGLPDVKLYPAVSAVYGNTEVSMVYLGHPLDG